MKRILSSLLAALLLSLASVVILAQAPINQAETDYRHQFDLYRTAHNKYQVAKAEYLQSHTVKAEQQAFEAAKNAALARIEVLRTYTRWLNLKLTAQSQWYPQASVISTDLTTLENWFTSHKAKLQATGSPSAYESIQAEYAAKLNDNNKTFALGQIYLKLGELVGLEVRAQNLYQPLLPVLEAQKTDHPEIEQGIAKINQYQQDFDREAAAVITHTGTIQAEAYRLDLTYSTFTERLENLRSILLTELNIITELENRYGR